MVTRSAADLAELETRVGQVPDPEVPVLTIADLGVLRDVAEEDGRVVVTITPTYSGCPAMHHIEDRITEVLAAADVDGVVIARIPPAWLEGALLPSELFEWLLLFTSPHERNLSDAYALASRVLAENPEAEIGVAVHGAAGRTEGEAAFGLLARSVEQRMGRSLVSYGMLVDDLDVYRSLAARQALGCAHPDSPARAALHEAAKRVFERARKAAFH